MTSVVDVGDRGGVIFYIGGREGRKQSACEEVACKVALFVLTVLACTACIYVCKKINDAYKEEPVASLSTLALIFVAIIASGCSLGALVGCSVCFVREGRFALVRLCIKPDQRLLLDHQDG